MRSYKLAVVLIVLLVGAVFAYRFLWDNTEETIDPSQVSIKTVPDGLTLWITDQTPRVADVVRISTGADPLARGSIFSSYLSQRIEPVKGNGFDQEVVITGTAGLNATLDLLSLLAPTVTIDLSNKKSVALSTTGTTTLALPDRTAFLTRLQDMDTQPKEDETAANFFGSLNSQNLDAEGTLYLVTAVYTADKMTYSFGEEGGTNASAECDATVTTCGQMNFSNKQLEDGRVTATGVPIFVRLKRIGRDPRDGALRYREDLDGPPAILGS